MTQTFPSKWLKTLEERGDIICGDDGYYIFWPNGNNGALTEHDLRVLADYLEEKNKEWHTTIMNDPNI